MIFVFVGRNRPIHEWDGILSKLKTPYHKFHDPDNCWYQQDYWIDEIKKALESHGRPNLSFGSSMGGWAALYYQPLIQAKKVIAFSPQASTVPDDLFLMGGKKNRKWAEHLKSTGYKGTTLPASDKRSTLYYGTHKVKSVNLGDLGHQQLAEKLGYTCINVESNDHNIAGVLNEDGQLLQILQDALN